MSGEKMSLFTSIAVNKQPKTDKDSVLTQKITVITSDRMASGTIGEFTQLIKDFNTAGIAITKDNVTIRGDKVTILNKNSVALFASDGKLNASLIDAKQIVTDGLQAATIDAKNATISNLIVNNAQVTGKVTATSGSIGGFEISDGNLISTSAYLKLGSEDTLGSRVVIIDAKNRIIEGNDYALIVKNYGTSTYSSLGVRAGIYIDVHDTSYNQLAGITMPKGVFAGARYVVNQISYNTNYNDTTVFKTFVSGMILKCINSSDITITLPSASVGAQKGDNFTMIKTGNGKITVKGSSYRSANGRSGQWECTSIYEHTHFIFDGSTWYSECTFDSK